MEKKPTAPELVDSLDKKIRTVKVVNSYLMHKLEQEKGKTISISRDDLFNILSVVEQFIDDYENYTEGYRQDLKQQRGLSGS